MEGFKAIDFGLVYGCPIRRGDLNSLPYGKRASFDCARYNHSTPLDGKDILDGQAKVASRIDGGRKRRFQNIWTFVSAQEPYSHHNCNDNNNGDQIDNIGHGFSVKGKGSGG